MATDIVNAGLLGTSSPNFRWQHNLGQGLQSILGNRDLAMALLANSGYSPQKRTFGEILGTSMLQANQAQQQRSEDDLKRRYMMAQINALGNRGGDLKAIIGEDGNPVYVTEADAIGKQPFSAMNRAEAPASLQELDAENEARKAKGLAPISISDWYRMRAQFAPLNPTVQMIGNVPTLVQPTNRQGGVMGVPLSTPQTELDAASGKARATATGSEQAKRNELHISSGIEAADAISTVRRGLSLLDTVETGGLDAVKLKATQMFGVTGADESELSANLGKAVLSQLRATFGAAFTEQEGQRLAEIEAGFGKSTEGNKRLLQQAEKILDRAARRGLRAAQDSGDKFSEDEIRKALEFSLDPAKPAPRKDPIIYPSGSQTSDGWTVLPGGIKVREKR